MALVQETPLGWLPFGSSDSTVLGSWDGFQAPTTTDFPGSTIVHYGTADSFDSTSGYTAGAGGSGVSGSYRIGTMTNYTDLDYEGQMTFQVPTDWLCVTHAATGSTGITLAATENVVSTTGVSGSTQWLTQTTSSVLSCAMNAGATTLNFDCWRPSATAVSSGAHTAGKDAFTTINIGWWGGKVGGYFCMAIDGLVVVYGARNNAANNGTFQYLYFGSDRNASNWLTTGYIRNFQISTRRPMLAAHPNLRHAYILSDSLCNTALIDSNFKDIATPATIRRYFEQRNLRFGDMTVSINTGDPITTGAGGADDLQDQIPAMLLTNPTVVFFRGGTNDVINDITINASWNTNELEAAMTAILAGSTVEKIVIGTIPSLNGSSTEDTTAKRAARDAINTYIKALPTFNSKIVVADVFAYLGGDQMPASYSLGGVSGALDDVHLSGIGHVKMGECYAKALLESLG